MIALGCDHGGYELMQEVKAHLTKRGFEYKDLGCYGTVNMESLSAVQESEFPFLQTRCRESVVHFAQIVSPQQLQKNITMQICWQWEQEF